MISLEGLLAILDARVGDGTAVVLDGDRFVALGPYCGYVDTTSSLKRRCPTSSKSSPPVNQEKALRMLDAVGFTANAAMTSAIACMGEKDADRGLDRMPKRIRFVTSTARYSRYDWLQTPGLQEHYQRAERALGVSEPVNITRFALFAPSLRGEKPRLRVGGKEVNLPDRAQTAPIELRDGSWAYRGDRGMLALAGKRPGLQGPIDDAFTGPSLCVRATGKPHNPAVGAWAETSLVLPKNAFGVDKGRSAMDGTTYTSATHTPVLVQPNPLNPTECVVLGSGHTFGEKELAAVTYLLFPRLGDWAVLDVRAKRVEGQVGPAARRCRTPASSTSIGSPRGNKPSSHGVGRRDNGPIRQGPASHKTARRTWPTLRRWCREYAGDGAGLRLGMIRRPKFLRPAVFIGASEVDFLLLRVPALASRLKSTRGAPRVVVQNRCATILALVAPNKVPGSREATFTPRRDPLQGARRAVIVCPRVMNYSPAHRCCDLPRSAIIGAISP